MWVNIGSVSPQNNWIAWHDLPTINLGLADKVLIKIEFNSANFSSIFSSCYIRFDVGGLKSEFKSFRVEPTSTITTFNLFPEISQDVTFEAKWKVSSRYSSEASWTASLSYWEQD